MESLLDVFDPTTVDAEAVLLDEATPSLIKHCVRKVAKKYDGDTQRAFAICVAQMQQGGYLEPGSMKLTAKGKQRSSRHAQEPDAAKKVKGYELLLKKAKKEGKSEKDLWAEALKMIASTKAAKKEAVEPDCLACEASDVFEARRLAGLGKYGLGKLSKMSADDKDHVVRSLMTMSRETLLRDSDQNAKLIQTMKGKKGHEDHVKDLEQMNKLYMKALALKNTGKSAGVTEMRRLAGIDKYPDWILANARSRLMDQQQREAAGLSGAHSDWKLEGLEGKVAYFLKRQGYREGEDFWFDDGMHAKANVAAEIADELNSLGEFGRAKLAKGDTKDSRRIEFGRYGE